jgi:hypothetical protein
MPNCLCFVKGQKCVLPARDEGASSSFGHSIGHAAIAHGMLSERLLSVWWIDLTPCPLPLEGRGIVAE